MKEELLAGDKVGKVDKVDFISQLTTHYSAPAKRRATANSTHHFHLQSSNFYEVLLSKINTVIDERGLR
ncbi:hypothetical protein ACQFX9_29260 [Aliinostoc sp. HNIBRCY26]|uniref:hypothetical protein n=1 Tax=Aliinostoc sp. HNIBRCY26 TaxID=3418997 RepID=UPI003D009FBD